MRSGSVSAPAVRRALDANQPLLRAAAPVIQSLARAMADSGYFAILTDPQGVVIDVNGPIDHHNRLAHLIARVGVDLSESAVGTTAIGTTLTEQQPVWLHRGEHFIDDTSAYSCAGAPLFGPDGRCVGMLDVTGIRAVERPELKHLVTQSAIHIENALLLGQSHALLLRLNWPGNHIGGDTDGLLCLNNDGQLCGSNSVARQMLPDLLSIQTGAHHISDVFGVNSEQLFSAARQSAPFELPLWSGLRLQVQAFSSTAPSRPVASAVALRDVEAALIRQAMQQANGNVMQAARSLGISRATVYRKLGQREPSASAAKQKDLP